MNDERSQRGSCTDAAVTRVAPSPLPATSLLKTPGIGGQIKVRPEDFIVDELPLYEPAGQGEHLYLRIQKKNLSHGDVMRLLARHFRVSEKRIGFAGMKDKRAITSQTFSIHTPHDPPQEPEIHPDITVAWFERHHNKIRRGHLAGNRFSIRIREVDPTRAPIVARQLRSLEHTGVPNYFGSQRFGYRVNNHILGHLLLRRQWDAFLQELLGTDGSPFPDYQRERRELFMQRRYAEALELWRSGYEAERGALLELARGRDPRRSVLGVGRRPLSFFMNAAQSAIFNRILDQRLQENALGILRPGDLAWKHDSRAVFAVTPDDLEGDRLRTLETRLDRLEISPSGPLWGPGMTRASGETDARELAALHEVGIEIDDLNQAPCRLEGARRPMRIPVANTQVDAGVDEHGPYIRLAFDLDRGSYATVLLREIMGADCGDEES